MPDDRASPTSSPAQAGANGAANPTYDLFLLLTDIEGSTRLWEEHPAAMSAALARHDRLIAELTAAHAGTVMGERGEGDSAFVVFDRAADAVASALELQRALTREPWPAATPLHVRMALHAGTVELREARFYGPPINRCARIRGSAHGGQTLLSETMREAVADRLPPGATLRDLGLHRLRDLARPERLYQLSHPDLRDEFPPLGSLDAFPNNLPVHLSSLVGREWELADARRLLQGSRLVTLTGPPGCGKTRLGIQVGAEVLEEFPDGVWLVELAPVADHGGVIESTVAALGLREQPRRTPAETLVGYLRDRRLLLILDNCEHVVDACAEMAQDILQRCPHVKILATGQEHLGLVGETIRPVPPLSLPPEDTTDVPLELLRASEAVRLFVERAASVRPGFGLDEATSRGVARICARLEGLPLAIELAAPLVQVLTVDEIAARLGDRFRLLGGRVRGLPPRHRTLRAAVDWSYELLTPTEQRLFMLLSVFAGGFTLDAAEAIAAEECDAAEIFEMVRSLVSKSMLTPVEGPAGTERYRMLETLRQYARERLRASRDDEEAARRHRVYFTELAQDADIAMRRGADAQSWLGRVLPETANFREAIRLALRARDFESAVRLAAALKWGPTRFGGVGEVRSWLEAALRRTDLSPRARLKALNVAAGFAWAQGDYSNAAAMSEESIPIARKLEDLEELAPALIVRGAAAVFQGDDARAVVCFGESLDLCQRIQDRWGLAWSLTFWGAAARMGGDFGAAEEHLERAIALFGEMGDTYGRVVPLFNLGMVARHAGDLVEARRLCEQSLALARDLGDPVLISSAMGFLGRVALATDPSEARTLFAQSLELCRRDGNNVTIAIAIEGLAAASALLGRFEEAARLWGFAERFREGFASPMPVSEQPEHAQRVADARAAIGEAAFARAWRRGAAMTLDGAFAFALAQKGDQASALRP